MPMSMVGMRGLANGRLKITATGSASNTSRRMVDLDVANVCSLDLILKLAWSFRLLDAPSLPVIHKDTKL